ncbi:MAG: hypothetical protein AAB692_01090, partial [Patescibacteria group bacterium]
SAVSFSAFFAKLGIGLGLTFLVFHAGLYFFLSSLGGRAETPRLPEAATVQDVVRLQSEVQRFNAQVSKLEALAQRNPDWKKAIGIAVGLENPGITLTGVFIEKPDEGLVISGVAKNRDALLQLKATANASGAFKDVEIPFTLLVAKGEIPFRFDLRFNDDQVLLKKH